MSTYRVACIGTGPDPDNQEWGVSASMAYRHADVYEANNECELVACADLVRDHAQAFADQYGLDEVYEDYKQMIESVDPDIVSVCTPVPTHANIVINCAAYESIQAIYCEKPMADTFGGCQAMVTACEQNDVELLFNHQRRFADAYLTARDLIAAGEIGTVDRFEIGGKNLFDFGSHLVDLCNGLNDEQPPEWALCQVDYRDENVRYGTHNENQALALWRYENGVDAFLSTGFGSDAMDAFVRVQGTDGVIDLWPNGEQTPLRLRSYSEGSVEPIDCSQETPMTYRAISDAVDSLGTDRTSVLSATHALNAMQIIFGCWESARRRARVSFPIEIEDNPLEAMVAAGELTLTASGDG